MNGKIELIFFLFILSGIKFFAISNYGDFAIKEEQLIYFILFIFYSFSFNTIAQSNNNNYNNYNILLTFSLFIYYYYKLDDFFCSFIDRLSQFKSRTIILVGLFN